MVAQEKKFSMLNFIKEICDDIGPRLGTTENEKKAGLRIKDILEKQVYESCVVFRINRILAFLMVALDKHVVMLLRDYNIRI